VSSDIKNHDPKTQVKGSLIQDNKQLNHDRRRSSDFNRLNESNLLDFNEDRFFEETRNIMHTNKSSSRTSSMSKRGTVNTDKNLTNQPDLIENFLKEVGTSFNQTATKSS